MEVPFNEALRNAVNESALKNSAVPVFICDENFTVTGKSTGAERLFPRPAVRNRITPYLPEEDIKTMLDGKTEHISTIFSRLENSSYCLITSGTVVGIKYYAVFIEPMVRFCPPTAPWYIEESIKHIRNVLDELMSDKKVKTYALHTVQTRFCRLCSFAASDSVVGNPFSDLAGILDFAASAAEPVLRSVRASLKMPLSSLPPIALSASSTNVYMMLATMIATSVMISSNGSLSLDCEMCDEVGQAQISVTTVADKYIKPDSNGIKGLICAENPMSLELAALEDMAEANGFILDAIKNDDRISLTLKIKAEKKRISTFHSADHPDVNVKLFATLLRDMLELLQ